MTEVGYDELVGPYMSRQRKQPSSSIHHYVCKRGLGVLEDLLGAIMVVHIHLDGGFFYESNE
jgi:hypothetical protein